MQHGTTILYSVHSFKKCLLSASCVLGPVLVIRVGMMNKTDMAHVLYEVYSPHSPV